MNLWRGVVETTDPLTVRRDHGSAVDTSGACEAGLLVGDWVWVLQVGRTVLVLGKNYTY